MIVGATKLQGRPCVEPAFAGKLNRNKHGHKRNDASLVWLPFYLCICTDFEYLYARLFTCLLVWIVCPTMSRYSHSHTLSSTKLFVCVNCSICLFEYSCMSKSISLCYITIYEWCNNFKKTAWSFNFFSKNSF